MEARYDARHEKFAPRERRNPRLLAHAYILGSFMRDAIIQEALTDQSHTLHIGIDYKIDQHINPDLVPMKAQYQKICPLTSHYRIFRGHQDMAKRFLRTTDEVGLFFEDDADPNRKNWHNVVNACITALERGEVYADCFYLYGREYDRNRFEVVGEVGGHKVLKLRADDTATEDSEGGRHHVFGSLAYLLTRDGAEQLVRLPWEGIPIDVILPDRLKFRLLEDSPFNHNRVQGSLTYPSSTRPPEVQTIARSPAGISRLHRTVHGPHQKVH